MTPLAKVIQEKGLKKGWVAEKAGVTPGTLSLILNGKSDPTIRVALKISRVVGMSIEELWGYLIDESEKPST